MKKLYLLLVICLGILLTGCGQNTGNPSVVDDTSNLGLSIGETAEYEYLSITLLNVADHVTDDGQITAQFEVIAYEDTVLNKNEFKGINSSGVTSTSDTFYIPSTDQTVSQLDLTAYESLTIEVRFTISDLEQIDLNYDGAESTWVFGTVTESGVQ